MSSYRRRLMLANQTEENIILYGNSVQDGTPTPDAPIEIMSLEKPTIKVTGKNLLKPAHEPGTVLTYGELTVTFNEDGSVTFNGANTTGELCYPTVGTVDVLANETYTLHPTPNSGGTTYQLYTYYPLEGLSQYTCCVSTTFKNITPHFDDTLTFKFSISENANFDNLTIYPMIEQVSIGDNLIPYPYYSKAGDKNDITFTVNEDGSITANGTATANAQFTLSAKFTLEQGQNYRLSGCPSGGKEETYYISLQRTDYKNTYLDYSSGKDFTANYNEYYIWIYVIAGTTIDNLTFRPTIKKVINPSEYKPYEEELITIDETTPFGKNLFKTTNYEKGTLDSATGNITSNTAVKVYCLTTDYIYLKSGAYVITNITGANLRYIAFYNTNKEFTSATWTARAKTFKFTVTEDCYVRIDVEIASVDGVQPPIDNYDTFLTEYEFMLNEGMNALPFEPYIPPVTTYRGIDDYKDCIYTKDGKVWYEQKVKHYKTDSFVSASKASAIIHQFSEINYPLCLRSGGGYVRMEEQMSNIGIYEIDYNKTGELHWYIAIRTSYLLPPDEETWTDATTAYEYLMSVTGNVPMEYQYVLATPIVTEITGTLAEKILAIDKTKNISVTSANGVLGNVEVIEE